MGQITTHVLDTACGAPAQDVNISVSRWEDEQWCVVAEGKTNQDGRAPELLKKDTLPSGIYQMRFHIEDYQKSMGRQVFYPWVDVVFQLYSNEPHYHIPLLLSPFGYSTYRGS